MTVDCQYIFLQYMLTAMQLIIKCPAFLIFLRLNKLQRETDKIKKKTDIEKVSSYILAVLFDNNGLIPRNLLLYHHCVCQGPIEDNLS